MNALGLRDWLLDPAHPSPRYLALRDLLARPDTDPDPLILVQSTT